MMEFDFAALSKEQVLDLGRPCSEYAEALKTRKDPGFDWSNSKKALAALRHYIDLQVKADKVDPEVEQETLYATSEDGSVLPIEVFRPVSRLIEPAPLVVMYFGGGFIMGAPAGMAPIARQIVKRLGVIVAAPSYRLAPEHPFPTGVNDGYDTFKWIARHATSKLRADPSKGFIIGGISAGANMSNVIAHLAHDDGILPPITGVWLSCSGVRIAPQNAHLLAEKYRERNLSREQEEIKQVSSPEMAKLGKECLQPNVESRLYAPMIWMANDASLGHRGFPKTYFQVCGMEPSRDEELIFDDILKGLGVATKVDIYPGLPHAFFYIMPELSQVKKWEEDTVQGFAWLLQQ